MTPQPTQQIPGVYHRKIGDVVVTAIGDGYLDGDLGVMRNVDLEKGTSAPAGSVPAGAANQRQRLPDPFKGSHGDC